MRELFQDAALCAGLAALAALAGACSLVGLRRAGRWIRVRLRPASLAAFVLLAVFAAVEAQKRGGGPGTPAEAVVPPPPGAETNARWLARGAYEDWFRVPATGWWARSAEGWLDGVTVLAWGEFRPGLRATNVFPRPFPERLSIAPAANWHLLADATGGTPVVPGNGQDARCPSLFWHGVTESNTLVMTWQNGLYARSATNLVSFQAELFNDGSVAYRYDDSPAATNDFVVPLVLPFDWDGDGLENSVDPDPLVAGPDAHGTNASGTTSCARTCSRRSQQVATLPARGREGRNLRGREGRNLLRPPGSRGRRA